MSRLSSHQPERTGRGFTLIEVMVVLVIVGVLVGMASLSFGRVDPDAPGAVAQRLQGWLDAARTRAMVENRDLRVAERDGRLELLVLSRSEEQQALGAPFELPEDLRIVWPEAGDEKPDLVISREGRWHRSGWALLVEPREAASDRPTLRLVANDHGEVEVGPDASD
ncbi:MAG: prepilin-type N-terminal cleavage/methylation domain-containing protein [Halothiobacillaceae bacterium]